MSRTGSPTTWTWGQSCPRNRGVEVAGRPHSVQKLRAVPASSSRYAAFSFLFFFHERKEQVLLARHPNNQMRENRRQT